MEHLVGYAKRDLLVPQAPFADLATANQAARAWCAEVNASQHGEIAAVPAERLAVERELLGPLPSLRLRIGTVTTRKVDRLACVRFGSARYSVPTRLIGHTVELRNTSGRLLVLDAGTGEIVADHALVAPGEASVADEHDGGPRPAPRRAVRPKTLAEKAFCALGPVAEAFITGAAAAGHTRLGPELEQLAALQAPGGPRARRAARPLLAALDREQARRLIAERFTVTPEVRRRRRSTKQTGKAPHTALKAQGKSQREAGHEATFPTTSLKAPPSTVNLASRPT